MSINIKDIEVSDRVLVTGADHHDEAHWGTVIGIRDPHALYIDMDDLSLPYATNHGVRNGYNPCYMAYSDEIVWHHPATIEGLTERVARSLAASDDLEYDKVSPILQGHYTRYAQIAVAETIHATK